MDASGVVEVNMAGEARVILLGPPGSGKGTQGKLLSQRLQIVHLSTGDLLRREVSLNTELGQKVKAVMESGSLVNDDLMNEVIQTRLAQADCKKGFVLDGYPRTTCQAEFLEAVLEKHSARPTAAVYIKIPDEEIIRRLQGRAQQESRADDNDEIVRFRLNVFKQETAPLFDFYRERGLFYEVNGLGAMEEVFTRLTTLIESL